MIRKYLLPLLAVLGVCLGFFMVHLGNKKVPAAQPVTPPSQPPFDTFVSGAGIIEANTENIEIGTHVAGIVQKIYVDIGSKVKNHDPLFTIDDRQIRAQLEINKAAVEVAKAQLANDKTYLALAESLTDKRAISVQEIDRRRYAVQTSQAKFRQAIAEVNSTQTALELLTVRAPVDGEILQLKVHLGEFAPAGALQQPLIILGNVRPLNVRVDIDETDAWRVKADAPAIAYLRGNKNINSPLEFVRFEPFVVPKTSLTGDSTERVDTRVLQVIYSIEKTDLPLYVGQLVDVYIQGPPHPQETTNEKTD